MNDYNYINMQDAFACQMYYNLKTSGQRTTTIEDLEEFATLLANGINDQELDNLKIYGNTVSEKNLLEFLFDNTDYVTSKQGVKGKTILELKSNVTLDTIKEDFEMYLIPGEILSAIDSWAEIYNTCMYNM